VHACIRFHFGHFQKRLFGYIWIRAAGVAHILREVVQCQHSGNIRLGLAEGVGKLILVENCRGSEWVHKQRGIEGSFGDTLRQDVPKTLPQSDPFIPPKFPD